MANDKGTLAKIKEAVAPKGIAMKAPNESISALHVGGQRFDRQDDGLFYVDASVLETAFALGFSEVK